MRPRFAMAAALIAAAALATPASALVATDTNGDRYDPTTRVLVPMIFPVAGPSSLTSYSDSWLSCRFGCTRKHMGQDLMGAKMTPLVAPFDGVVTALKRDSGSAGNYVAISADRGPAAGWTAFFLHVNNDTPGTDDARGSASWAFPAGIAPGARVLAGQLVAWRGDSGNAEQTGAHVHFELRKGTGWDGVAYNALPSLRAARHILAPTPSGPHPTGSVLRHPNGLLFLVDGLTKRPISATVLVANGRQDAAAVPMTASESMGYATQAGVVLRDGTIARDTVGTLWLVTGGKRVAVTPAALAALGRPAPRIWPATEADLAALTVTDVPPASPLYPGALVRTDGTTEIRYVDAGGAERSVDAASLASHGWTTQDVAVIPAVLAPATPAQGAPVGTFHRTSTGSLPDSSAATGPLPIRDGTLVQTPSHLVGVVGGSLRRLWDSRMVKAYGYDGRPRLYLPTAAVSALPTAELTAR